MKTILIRCDDCGMPINTAANLIEYGSSIYGRTLSLKIRTFTCDPSHDICGRTVGQALDRFIKRQVAGIRIPVPESCSSCPLLRTRKYKFNYDEDGEMVRCLLTEKEEGNPHGNEHILNTWYDTCPTHAHNAHNDEEGEFTEDNPVPFDAHLHSFDKLK